MKTSFIWFLCIFIFYLVFPSTLLADEVMCRIEIRDNMGKKYSVEQEIDIVKNMGPQKLNFETPGSEYSCTLTFFGFDNGTMLSCEYKEDEGATFFRSDRSGLKDKVLTNNLSFRYKKSQLSIKTKCK